MEILTSVRRLYIRFKSLVNDSVYSFGRAALLLLVEVQNHTVPVRERGRIRVKELINRALGCVFYWTGSEQEAICLFILCLRFSKHATKHSSTVVLQKCVAHLRSLKWQKKRKHFWKRNWKKCSLLLWICNVIAEPLINFLILWFTDPLLITKACHSTHPITRYLQFAS